MKNETESIEALEAVEERQELFSEMIENGAFNLKDNRRISEGNLRYSLQEILLLSHIDQPLGVKKIIKKQIKFKKQKVYFFVLLQNI